MTRPVDKRCEVHGVIVIVGRIWAAQYQPGKTRTHYLKSHLRCAQIRAILSKPRFIPECIIPREIIRARCVKDLLNTACARFILSLSPVCIRLFFASPRGRPRSLGDPFCDRHLLSLSTRLAFQMMIDEAALFGNFQSVHRRTQQTHVPRCANTAIIGIRLCHSRPRRDGTLDPREWDVLAASSRARVHLSVYGMQKSRGRSVLVTGASTFSGVRARGQNMPYARVLVLFLSVW